MAFQQLNQRSERQGSLLQQLEYTDICHVAKSLQGNIWRATKKTESGDVQKVVVKTAETLLHENNVAQVKGQYYAVHEDIIKEAEILKLVTNTTDCPKSIVKFSDLVHTKSDICLAMEDGGNSLFQFIVRCHKIMKQHKDWTEGKIGDKPAHILPVAHWMKVVHLIFKQMIECVEYIHSKNVCHFDISLENFLINDVSMIITEHKKDKIATFCLDDIQVKLCDFGLAEINMMCGMPSNKFCGKKNYKAPEVVAQKSFDPRSNDLWCLGVCLFTVAFGSNPWQEASPSDQLYQIIAQKGMMVAVLQKWQLLDYATNDIVHLLMAIFKPQHQRITIQAIKNSAYYNRQ